MHIVKKTTHYEWKPFKDSLMFKRLFDLLRDRKFTQKHSTRSYKGYHGNALCDSKNWCWVLAQAENQKIIDFRYGSLNIWKSKNACVPWANTFKTRPPINQRWSWVWRLKVVAGHKLSNQVVAHISPLFDVAKVKHRGRGYKRRRHEAGSLKSGNPKNLSLPYDLYRLWNNHCVSVVFRSTELHFGRVLC